MENVAVQTNNEEIISNLVLNGDLSKMTATQRVQFYNQFCEKLGLNPLTLPFQLISFQGKLRMYSTKDCSEQLRKIHGVSITDLSSKEMNGVYVVTAKAMDRHGKTDAATGAVTIEGLKGDALANAIMKAESKAKRRVTLSICGLGLLDATEIETIPDTKEVSFEAIDLESITQSVQEAGSMEDLKKVWETIPKAMQKDKEILNVFTTQRKKLNG